MGITPSLPPVGTNALLERLSGYVPDDFIAASFPRDFTGGRRHVLSAAQLVQNDEGAMSFAYDQGWVARGSE